MSRALVLVGLSGSGKSTVGRLVASKLGLPFIDVDRHIEEITGKSVAGLFAEDGEQEFRRLESAALRTACGTVAVIATGGGAVLYPANRSLMREGNLVVWLDVPVPALVRRLAGHSQGEERPLLSGTDLYERLERLSQERRSLYQMAAHVRCGSPDTMPIGSRRIAAELVEIYRAWSAAERDKHVG